MRIIYKRRLAFIGFLIAICGLVGIGYLFYDEVINDDTLVVASGELSINYINGNNVSGNDTYRFSVTNNGSNDMYYEISIDNLVGYDSKLSYNVISSEANINIINGHLEEDNFILVDNILIKTGVTQNFVLKIENNNFTTFKLNVKKITDTEEYFFNTILSDNNYKTNTITKVGESIAEVNEGLIEDTDDYGLTYYFRGNILNNYVSFADRMWRIVRINGDGTVKLVLDAVTGELTNYNTDIENYGNFSDTDINNALLTYYENNLKAYDSYIAKTKYCVEMEFSESDEEKTYNGYNRLVADKIPSFNCLGDKYTSKIGLLTADEVVFAGANFEDDNEKYYLYNEEIENVWWTSTLATGEDDAYYPFSVTDNGEIDYSTSGVLYRDLRPTINLIKKVAVTGSGTKDNPYIIIE